MDFKLVSDYAPMGDQPEAIGQLVSSIEHGSKHNTLLGVTGSGKTFTVANVIARLNRPTLVLSHNKTLAAQLYGEFRNFFPENAVEYFVSYYDYYQPEAYLPSTDTYIEKDLQINAEIEKMRLGTVATLLSGRRDVIVVSSVSCLYGAGNPADFHATAINIKVGQVVSYKHFLYKLVEALYTRTERELEPATFRVNGDTVDIMAAFGEFGNQCFRVMFFDNEVEAIQSIDPVTGQRIASLDSITLYAQWEAIWEGTGTAEDPYQIPNGEKLAALAPQVNDKHFSYEEKWFRLTDDIDLSGFENWTPIGNSFSDGAFAGNLDGNHKSITGLNVHSDKQFAGLFGVAVGNRSRTYQDLKLSGTVVAVNTELENAPEVMNSDPYGAWLIKVENVEGSEELLDAAAYEAFCAEEG